MSLAKITTTITAPSIEAEEPSQQKFKVSIRICAIKKRCRKIAQHSFTVSYVDYNNGIYDQDAIRQVVIDFVASNVKNVCSHCVVHLDHVEQSFNGRFNCETWQPFSDKNKRFEIAQSAFHN